MFGGGLELHSSPGRFLQSKHFSPAPWTPGQKIRRTNFWQRTSAKESRRELCTTGKGGERWKYTAENQKAVVQLCLSVNRCVNGCAGTSPSDALVHYCVKGDIFRDVSKRMACPYSLNSIMDLQRNYRQLLGFDMSRASQKRKVQ